MTSRSGTEAASPPGAAPGSVECGTPVWFGPPGRPLFGMVHVPPAGVARGGVVLCPPLGREDLSVHSAYRALAGRLAAEGLGVVRFDYDGTGNSSGSLFDPDRVTAWTASIVEAVDLLRSVGVPSLTLVGMRMGALLAQRATADRRVDALVLWDPCRSGRAFLRELQALHHLSIEEPPTTDGSVRTPGFSFDTDTVGALGALDMAKDVSPLAPRILVLTRPDRPLDRATQVRLSEAGTVQIEPALGQREILAVDGLLNEAVEDTIGRLAAWISASAPAEFVALRRVLLDNGPEALVTASDGAPPVVERAVRFGDVGLFGVVTEPLAGAGTAPPGSETMAPTVVCFNTGKTRLVGPSRLWVDLARLWAAQGIRTLRVDLSGLGDSGKRPGQPRDVFYPVWAAQDIEMAARFASPGDPSQVVFVGLCSGAFHAVLGGVLLGARGVCALNPVFNRRSIRARADEDTSEEPRPDASGAGGLRPTARAVASTVRRRVVAPAARALPEPVWSLSTHLGLRRSPVRYLQRMVRAGTHVLLVTGVDEADLIRRGATRTLRHLGESGRLRFDVIGDLHHALFGSRDRPRIHDLLSRHVVETFGPPGKR